MYGIGRGIFDQKSEEGRNLVDKEGDEGEVDGEEEGKATTHGYGRVWSKIEAAKCREILAIVRKGSEEKTSLVWRKRERMSPEGESRYYRPR